MHRPFTPIFSISLSCIVRYNPTTYFSALKELGQSPKSPTFHETLTRIVRKHIIHVLKTDKRIVHDVEGDERAWVIAGDAEICRSGHFARGNGETRCCDVKLTSPFFKLDTGSLHEVQCVVHALMSEFEILTDVKYGGLHVRVGNEGESLELQTVKDFCILATGFERQLSSLHPVERVVDGNCTIRQTGESPGKSAFHVATDIQKCRSPKEIMGLFSTAGHLPDTHLAYDLASFGNASQCDYIEFRQHEACLDLNEIVWWAELACGLVTRAHELFLEDLSQLIQNTILDKKDVLDLLSRLQLTGPAEYYRGRKRYSHPNIDDNWLTKILRDQSEENMKRLKRIMQMENLNECR